MSNDEVDLEEDNVIFNSDVFYASNMSMIIAFVKHCGSVKIHVHVMTNLTNYNLIPKKTIVLDGTPPQNGQHLTLCWERTGSVKMDNYTHPPIETLTTEDLVSMDALTKRNSYETIHNFGKKGETRVYHLFLVNLNPIVFFSVISLQSYLEERGNIPTKISKNIIYRKIPFNDGQLSKCIYYFVDVMLLLHILENDILLTYILEREFYEKKGRGVKWAIIEPSLKIKNKEVRDVVNDMHEKIIEENYECSHYYMKD